MATFVNGYLLWGLALVALPVLIHLINVLRHRHVRWAAMEFLLESQRRNSRWIRMKELLLLLLRMAAVAALVLILAQPLLNWQFGALFGGQRTHHLVLLDDSFSMSDQFGEATAFDQAKQAVERLAENLARQTTPQSLTLLRTSQATEQGGRADWLEELVTSDFGARIAERMRSWEASQSSVSIRPSLDSLERLVGDPEGERRVYYVVSDFRAKDWDNQTAGSAGPLAERIAEITESGARLQLVACVDAPHKNLAIESIALVPGTHAASVPQGIELVVRNYGLEQASNVTVRLETDDNPAASAIMDQIAPGEAERRVVPLTFSTAGEHAVTARLEQDAVRADNARHMIVRLPTVVQALLIDADPNFAQSRPLATALAPGGHVKTGIQVRVEPPAFLNANPLEAYQAIYLVNVDRLDERALAKLEQWVQGGGGLAIFAGDLAQPAFYNAELYRDGTGLLPAPFDAPTYLLVNRLEKTPDIQPTDHPIFRVFLGERNTFLSAVIIDRFHPVKASWPPAPNSSTRVIATLRNGSPLAIEKPFGKGRVVAFYTTAGPVWNNWAPNPSFVVAMLELEATLASQSAAGEPHRVGSPVTLELPTADFKPHVRLSTPPDHPVGPSSTDAAPAGDEWRWTFPDITRAGVYEVQLTTAQDAAAERRFAVNVDAEEGDLEIAGASQLARRLEGVPYEWVAAGDFAPSMDNQAGSNWSDWLLYGLIVMLVGEQVLAYSASYHPPQLPEVRR